MSGINISEHKTRNNFIKRHTWSIVFVLWELFLSIPSTLFFLKKKISPFLTLPAKPKIDFNNETANLTCQMVCSPEPSEKLFLEKILGRWLEEPSVHYHLSWANFSQSDQRTIWTLCRRQSGEKPKHLVFHVWCFFFLELPFSYK